jgi:type I restriction enzyme S subunit
MSSNWPLVSLGEIIRLERRPAVLKPEHQYQEIGIYCFGRGIFHKTPRTGLEIGDKDLYELRDGDVILQVTFAWEGAIALCSKAEHGLYGSIRYPTFRVDETRCFAPFLVRYLGTRDGLEQINKICPGSAGRNRVLNLKRIHEVLVPLPALSEQRRIVARIENLAAKINETREVRAEVNEETDALIKAHFNRLFGNYNDGSRGDLNLRRWVQLNDVVTDVADGPHITPTYVEEGVPFITVLNITSGRIRFGNNKYVTLDDHAQFQKRARTEVGDVLISKDGTIGIPCLVDTDRPFSFFVSVALVKPQRDPLDGEFLRWVIRAPYLQKRIRERSRGDMIRHLILREIRDLTIPLPSLPAQRRIVTELNAFQERVDALKKLQSQTAVELDALLPSVLDKAFKGKL